MGRGRLVGGLVGLVLVAGLALVPGVGVADSSVGVSEVEASRRAMTSGAAVVASALTTERRLVTAYPDGSFCSGVDRTPPY